MYMTFIDVRTPAEFTERHHPDAINFPLENIMAGQLPDVPKDASICLYCRSGARSGAAQQLLTQAGFTNLTNGGGIDDVFPQ